MILALMYVTFRPRRHESGSRVMLPLPRPRRPHSTRRYSFREHYLQSLVAINQQGKEKQQIMN
jgi:hypothetical protein